MNTGKQPQISVVVPTYRRPDLLARCLQALARQTLFPADYEIIVCDDGPTAQAAQVVSALRTAMPGGPLIHYLEVFDTQGPAAARNRGWRWSRAAAIAFTDDDTVPEPGWLAAGLQAINAGADAVSGRLVMPMPRKPSDLERDAAGLTSAEFVTANCFIRRSALLRVGGFDERFETAWREDSDLHFNLIEAGYVIVKASAAVVVHPLRPMAFAAGIGMQRKMVYDVLLYRKHPVLYRERIRAGPPWFYLVVSFLLALSLLSTLAGNHDLALVSWVLWSLLTLRFFLKRMANSALTARNALELFLTSIAIPPLAIFWRVVGVGRYGAGFP
jgi:GT2 family glycosyltransferase